MSEIRFDTYLFEVSNWYEETGNILDHLRSNLNAKLRWFLLTRFLLQDYRKKVFVEINHRIEMITRVEKIKIWKSFMRSLKIIKIKQRKDKLTKRKKIPPQILWKMMHTYLLKKYITQKCDKEIILMLWQNFALKFVRMQQTLRLKSASSRIKRNTWIKTIDKKIEDYSFSQIGKPKMISYSSEDSLDEMLDFIDSSLSYPISEIPKYPQNESEYSRLKIRSSEIDHSFLQKAKRSKIQKFFQKYINQTRFFRAKEMAENLQMQRNEEIEKATESWHQIAHKIIRASKTKELIEQKESLEINWERWNNLIYKAKDDNRIDIFNNMCCDFIAFRKQQRKEFLQKWKKFASKIFKVNLEKIHKNYYTEMFEKSVSVGTNFLISKLNMSFDLLKPKIDINHSLFTPTYPRDFWQFCGSESYYLSKLYLKSALKEIEPKVTAQASDLAISFARAQSVLSTAKLRRSFFDVPPINEGEHKVDIEIFNNDLLAECDDSIWTDTEDSY